MATVRFPLAEGRNLDKFIDELIEMAKRHNCHVEGFYEHSGNTFIEVQYTLIQLHVEPDEKIEDLLKRMQALHDRTGYAVTSNYGEVPLYINDPDRVRYELGYYMGYLDARAKYLVK